MAVAQRAAQAYKRERTNGMFNAKASLPDLTFLKDYGDENPKQVGRSGDQNQMQIKNSASAAVIGQRSKEKSEIFINVNLPK